MQGEDSTSSCICSRSMNDVFLARFADVGEGQVVESCVNRRMGITDLLGQR